MSEERVQDPRKEAEMPGSGPSTNGRWNLPGKEVFKFTALASHTSSPQVGTILMSESWVTKLWKG